MANETSPKEEKKIVLGKNKSKVVLHPPLYGKMKKEAMLNRIASLVVETKADKVGQAYSKRDYDMAYSAPYEVINNPIGPASLKDLAFRVIMVRSEYYDQNEDAIIAEAKGKRVSEMTPSEVGEYKKMQQGGKDWVAGRQASHHNIIEHYNAATPDEKAYGHSWYEDAHHLTKHVAKGTKTPMHTVAGLVGNYSPQTNWADNIMTAEKVARHKTPVGGPGSGVFASLHQKEAAGRMMGGEHHTNVLKGHKIRAFTHLIEHGGNADPSKPQVVIDRHAAAVAHGDRITDAAYKFGLGGLKSKALYNSYADHYHKAAEEINRQSNKGPGWKPVEAHQVQAVTWLVRQRRNQAMEEAGSKKKSSKTAGRAAKSQVALDSMLKQHYPQVGDTSKMVGYNAAGTRED